MAFEQKPNTGSVFQNDRKTQETHADRTGSALIECPHCGASWQSWVNGWLKKTKDGKPFLSLSFRPKEDRQNQGQRRPPAPPRPSEGQRSPPAHLTGRPSSYADRRADPRDERAQWDEKLNQDDIPF